MTVLPVVAATVTSPAAASVSTVQLPPWIYAVLMVVEEASAVLELMPTSETSLAPLVVPVMALLDALINCDVTDTLSASFPVPVRLMNAF